MVKRRTSSRVAARRASSRPTSSRATSSGRAARPARDGDGAAASSGSSGSLDELERSLGSAAGAQRAHRDVLLSLNRLRSSRRRRWEMSELLGVVLGVAIGVGVAVVRSRRLRALLPSRRCCSRAWSRARSTASSAPDSVGGVRPVRHAACRARRQPRHRSRSPGLASRLYHADAPE